MFQRLHPEFPGPIGKPKAGRLARYSFTGISGKRQFHRVALDRLAPEIAASITGEKGGRK